MVGLIIFRPFERQKLHVQENMVEHNLSLRDIQKGESSKEREGEGGESWGSRREKRKREEEWERWKEREIYKILISPTRSWDPVT